MHATCSIKLQSQSVCAKLGTKRCCPVDRDGVANQGESLLCMQSHTSIRAWHSCVVGFEGDLLLSHTPQLWGGGIGHVNAKGRPWEPCTSWLHLLMAVQLVFPMPDLNTSRSESLLCCVLSCLPCLTHACTYIYTHRIKGY